MIICSKCGKENDQDARFCEFCGNPMEHQDLESKEEKKDSVVNAVSTADAVVIDEASETKPEQEVQKKKFSIPTFKVPKISLDMFKSKKAIYVGIAGLAIVILVSILIFSKDSSPLIFVRDSQLVLRDGSETILIHDEFSEGYANSDYMSPDTLAGLMKMSSDEKYLYYLTDLESGYDLYSYEIDKAGKTEPVKVSTTVGAIYVPEDGKGVYYLKNYDGYSGKLYYYDQNASNLIAKNVSESNIVAIGKNIAYIEIDPDTGTQSLYLYDTRKQEEYKVDTNVSALYAINLSGKPSDIVYGKNGETYGVESIYLSGYEVEKEKLVNNAEIMSANANTIYYCVDKDGKTALYQYNIDTKESVKLCANIGGCVALSPNIIEYYDIEEEAYFVSFSNGIRIESIGACLGATINESKNCIILLESEDVSDINGTDGFSIILFTLNDGVLDEKIVLSEDASRYCYYDAKNDIVYYLEDVDSRMHGTLYGYKKGAVEKIADDVFAEMIGVNEKTAEVIYFTDVLDDIGTMHLFDGKKSARIGSDVHCEKWVYTEKSELLYLANWDMANGGEYYQFTGKKSERIASDVQAFFAISASNILDLAHAANW